MANQTWHVIWMKFATIQDRRLWDFVGGNVPRATRENLMSNTLFKKVPPQTSMIVAVTAATAIALTGPTVLAQQMMRDLEWHRRVLIVSAPSSRDPLWIAEEEALRAWTGDRDRDVTVVRIDGGRVAGIDESGAEIRKRYKLSESEFSIALIGKDGHVALLSSKVLTGPEIDAVIDAMPMRKAGQR